MNPGRLGALASLLALKGLLGVALLRSGFVGVSGDDFMRALIALEWAERPFVVSAAFDTASSLWLPLPFWLNGTVLQAVPAPWLVPVAVNLALSLASLAYLYGIALRLFDHPTGLLTVILLGVLPWYAWLSISGLAEIPLLFFLAAALYYLVRWEVDRAPRWTALAGVATLGATMVRPEGWLYTVPVSLRFGAAAIRSRRWGLVLGAALPWVFVAYWLGFNYVTYGEPWHFIRLSHRNFRLETGGFDSPVIRLLQFPFLMVTVSPTLVLLLLPALFGAWRRGSPAVRRFAALVGGGCGLLIGAGLFGLGTTSAPQRYVIVPLALFAPLIAGWCRQVLWVRGWRWLAVVGILGYIAVNVLFGFHFSREFEDEARVGAVLATLRERGLLEGGALVASDRALAAATRRESLTPERRVRLLSDRWALQVLSGMPEAFVDRDWSVDGPEGRPDLQDRRVRVIAVKAADLMEAVPPRFTAAGRVGTYRLYTAGIPRLEMPPSPPLPLTRAVRAELGALRFEGYTQEPGPVARVVRLMFSGTETARATEPVTVRVRLIGPDGSTAVRSYPVREYLPDGPRWMEVPVRFNDEFRLPAGRYRLAVTVLDTAGSPDPIRRPAATGGEVILGPFYLVPGKRQVLKAILTTGHQDPWLVARVLLAL